MELPLNELGAAEAARGIAAGQIKAADLLDACFNQIERWEPSVHAWVHLNASGARAAASAVDREVSAGNQIGPLGGVPVGIKDIFNSIDMPTQMGSPIWTGFTPGNDARIVHYLRMAGAVIPGKTVTAEFAVHAPGPTENPHRLGYIPGTSSSGSAAAVAAYMVPVALGTQTAGSVIRPASYCGVFGFKPSFGLVPRTGMLKTTDSLDTVGWFARNAEDLKLLFDIVRVKGADYPISEAALCNPTRQKRQDGPWRIALVHGPKWEDAESYAHEALSAFAARLSTTAEVIVEEVEAPVELAEAHDVHATIYDRALAYYFKEEFQQHTLVSPNIYEIIERGNRLGLDDYQAALARQRQIALTMERLFMSGYDALLDIATGGSALEGLDTVDRPDHALIWTLCGLPAVSVPAASGPDGMPLGLQFVARRYNDLLLFELLDWIEAQGLLPRRTNPEPPMSSRFTPAEPVIPAAGAVI